MGNGCHIKPEQFFNLILGYNDILHLNDSVASVNGSTNLNLSEPPAGEVWVITNFSVSHSDTTARTTGIRLTTGGTTYPIMFKAAVPTWETVNLPSPIVIGNGDVIQGRVLSLATGKTLYISADGYKVKIAQ